MKMKRILLSIITLAVCFTIAACGKEEITITRKNNNENPVEEKIEKTPDTSTTSAPVIENEPEEVSTALYPVKEADAGFLVPEGYMAISRDVELTDEEVDKLGYSRDKIERYLSLTFYDVIILPEGYNFSNTPVEFRIEVKNPEYDGINFGELSKPEQEAIAQVLILGFNEDKYELVKTDTTTFIKFYTKLQKPELRYATIIDGRMIYIYATEDGGIEDKYADVLESIVFSFRKNDGSNYTSNEGEVPDSGSMNTDADDSEDAQKLKDYIASEAGKEFIRGLGLSGNIEVATEGNILILKSADELENEVYANMSDSEIKEAMDIYLESVQPVMEPIVDMIRDMAGMRSLVVRFEYYKKDRLVVSRDFKSGK
ncbi:MAG: hypothetical protein MJ133_01815 [Lachnospiraceae bacterium]|nr:hypothetical protein [Lachnospiraceae bacterium]